VAVSKAWRDLHRCRFPDLPLDCGNTLDPGVIYSEDLRDWSDKATTPDQARMERYIDRYDLNHKRVLHVGIGNSGLARRFHGRVKEIVGTTIDEPELKVARSLGFPNYAVVLHNKFSGGSEALNGQFDFILDNNPTSPCCCIRHLAALFDLYAAKLKQDGQVVTDAQGLKWVPDDSNPRWSFDFDDLAAVSPAAGFSAFRANTKVYVLSRTPPASPGSLPVLRHLLRRARMLPGQVVRSGPRKLERIARKSMKWVLLSTVPWAVPKRYRPDQ
jgi:hypothetical protein